MPRLPSLAYARVVITVRNVNSTVTHVSTCIVNVKYVLYTLNTPFMILHLQIFRIMEGVRVLSYVSKNSGNFHLLPRFDYVRVCMHVCLSSFFCFFFSSSSIAPAWRESASPPSERELRVWKRKDNVHTHKEGGGEEE